MAYLLFTVNTPSLSQTTRNRMRTQLKRRGITHDRIAAEANVSRTCVVHVLAGRGKSQNVVNTIKRLIAEVNPTGGRS